MIPLDKVKIDSFRFYLPLSKVIVNSNHSEFMRKITRVNEDGEILSEELKLTHFNKEAIVSPKYEVIRQFGNAPDIAVSINSKFLLSKYFTGINKETVDICLDFINADGLITITKEDFLSSIPLDIDFCFDTYLSSEVGTIEEVVRICSSLTIPQKKQHAQSYNRLDNKGYQWGIREKVGKAYVRGQFLKYYAKELELTKNKKTIPFFEAYLKEPLTGNKHFEHDRLLRVETTIKNKPHFKTYGLEIQTIKDLIDLDLDSDEVLSFFKRPMSIYMTGYKEIKHQVEMTINQREKYLLCYMKATHKAISMEQSVRLIAFDMHPQHKRKNREYRNQLYTIINMQEVGKKTHRHNTENWARFISEIEGKNLIPKNM